MMRQLPLVTDVCMLTLHLYLYAPLLTDTMVDANWKTWDSIAGRAVGRSCWICTAIHWRHPHHVGCSTLTHERNRRHAHAHAHADTHAHEVPLHYHVTECAAVTGVLLQNPRLPSMLFVPVTADRWIY